MLALLGAVAFAPFVLQLAGRPIANATMIGAGLGFAWSGLVNQFVADAAQNGHWGTARRLGGRRRRAPRSSASRAR